MKQLISDPNDDESEVVAKFGEFRREVWVMSGLKHPNIGIFLYMNVSKFIHAHKCIHNSVLCDNTQRP